jgi:hypothetical protein
MENLLTIRQAIFPVKASARLAHGNPPASVRTLQETEGFAFKTGICKQLRYSDFLRG